MSESKNVSIPIEVEVYDMLEKAAERQGLTVNEFAEKLCRENMDRIEEYPLKLIKGEQKA